jgi:hypothetical protein
MVKDEVKYSIKSKHEKYHFFDDALELNQIIQLKDRSYYMQNEAIHNIFRFAFNPELITTAGKSKLDSYYFCHDSMKEILQKRKNNIYRDISRLSRHLIL